MSDVKTEEVSPQPIAEGKPKEYGFSALLTGFARMWRGFVPAIIAIVGNAVVQAVLTFWNPQVGLSVAFIIAAVISIAVLIVWLAVLSRTALGAVTGRVSVGHAISGVRPVLGRFALWTALQWLLILVGFLLLPLLGLLIGLVTVFVPLAAADGESNPLGANFKALKDRWGRWLVTSVILLVLLVILLLLSAVNVFFITGFAASLIFWLVFGFIALWLLTAYAAIYRSTRVGRATQD
jgi:hypothetical protein